MDGNFPVHPDTLHIIWIFCIAKYPEIPQPIINLSQKLSGFAKSFRSALLTRWRGFCDSARETSPVLIANLKVNSKRKKRLKKEGPCLLFGHFWQLSFLISFANMPMPVYEDKFQRVCYDFTLCVRVQQPPLLPPPKLASKVHCPFFCVLECPISQVAREMHWIYPPTSPTQW